MREVGEINQNVARDNQAYTAGAVPPDRFDLVHDAPHNELVVYSLLLRLLDHPRRQVDAD